MRTLICTAFACSAAACTPPTAPQARTPESRTPLQSAELVVKPAGQRSYRLTVRERAAVERRGPGPGRIHHDVAMRLELRRDDAPAASGDGIRSTFTFARVEASAYEPVSEAAARAATALQGAKVVTEVDRRGAVRSFFVEGAERAKPLAERLAAAFLKMTPAFPPDAKNLGGRWGETATIPVEVGGKTPTSLRTNVQASYVFQRAGELSGRNCAVVQVDLRPGANAVVEGTPEGAVTSSGTGQGELCLDPTTGHLRMGSLDLTLRTEVALRQSKSPRVRPLHFEETRRLRMEVVEVSEAG